MNKTHGLTLIEMLIYLAIFTVSAVLFVSILVAVTRVQNQQLSMDEVNQQLSFVANTIQRLVRDSSAVDIPVGTATTTLTLRMEDSAEDPILIYTDASSSAIYVSVAGGAPQALTDTNVTVQSFLVTKYENPGGQAVVQADIALSYNTQNPRRKYSNALRTAVTRVTAATFDSNILPNTDNMFDLGTASNKWKDAYFSGSIGIGVSPVSAAKILSSGDIGFTSSSVGIVLRSPGGTCYRVTVNDTGTLQTNAVSCP